MGTVWSIKLVKHYKGRDFLGDVVFMLFKQKCIFREMKTGVQLLVLFCSSVPVVLFDTPGISRCRSQHVSVESSFLLHHSIYLWFICFTWWSIDELENLHADRTTVCFEPWWKLRARFGARKTGLSPPVFLYWPSQGGTSVVVPYCSCCLYLYFGSAIMLVTYFVNFR